MANFLRLFAVSLLIGTTVQRNCNVTDSETIQCNYFPNNISEGISRVKILDFVGLTDHIKINSSYLEGEGWRHIKYLEISNSEHYDNDVKFTAETFSSLKVLNELRIHLSHVNLDPDVFVELNSVKILNVKNCFRLGLNDLLQTLNGTDKLQGLQRLTITGINGYHLPIIIGEHSGDILQQKKLTYLDMSNTQIAKLNGNVMKYLKYLRYLNISGSLIIDINLINFKFLYLKGVVLDISNATLPHLLKPTPGKLFISNKVLKTSSPKSIAFTFFTQVNAFIASSIMPVATYIWIKNVTFIIDKPINIFFQRLILRENNIRWLDFNIVCVKTCVAADLEEIDISHNGMQFFNCNKRKLAPNLKIINLSSNQFHIMAKNNMTLFEMLFNSLSKLHSINLSNNGLITIPVNMFRDNYALREIDLSDNKLEQITFSLNHLSKLERLDLQRNFIHILSQESLGRLNSIPQNKQKNRTHEISVLFSNNPISCSQCDAKDFLQWLITTNLVKTHLKDLRCMADNGHQTTISKRTVQDVQSICDRVKIILISCVSGLVSVTVTVYVLVLLHRYRKEELRIKRREKIVQHLENGENRYQYAVFLTFSSDDGTFVGTIYDHLERHLKDMTGIERKMVCYDDNPNYLSINDINNCLARSSVIVVVVSNNYFGKPTANYEITTACHEGTPIVLMLTEHIDKRTLPDYIAPIYNRTTKILGKVENGEYVLQDTWENVASSVLDLIQ